MKHLHLRWLAQTLFCLVLLIFGFALNAAAQVLTIAPPTGLTASVDGSLQPPISPTGPFTISSQEPVTLVPNGNAMFFKLLPSTVGSHLAVQGGAYLASSATMISDQMTVSGTCNGSSCRGGSLFQTSISGGDQGVAKYYGQASDPYYVIASGGCNYSPNPGTYGVPFHAPSGAKFPNSGGDAFLVAWDQTNNNIFGFYVFGKGAIAFPPCSASTSAMACSLSGYNGCGNSNFNSTTVLTNQNPGYASNGILPFNGMVRQQEIVQGQINHAIYLNLGCTSGTYVYPNINTNTAGVCSPTSLGIPSGALIFLDYTPAQLADLKTKLDAWQYPFIQALTLYGGYIGDTGSYPGLFGIWPSRIEDDSAYVKAGVPTPHPAGYSSIYSWLSSFPHALCAPRNGGTNCYIPIFENIPLEGGGDIVSHMHVADQCVAKALAGVSGGCP